MGIKRPGREVDQSSKFIAKPPVPIYGYVAWDSIKERKYIYMYFRTLSVANTIKVQKYEVHMGVDRNIISIVKQTRCTNVSNYLF